MSEAAEDGETSDVDVLRSACNESRAVLDDQLHELSDIADKALWTVRTSMLVLGVVVSAASLGDASTFERLQDWILWLGLAGIVLLLGASVWGLGTYFVSDRVRGISPGYRARARDVEVREHDWYRVLLDGYDHWIAEMERITDYYGSHLFWAQATFLLGILLVVLAAVLSVRAL